MSCQSAPAPKFDLVLASCNPCTAELRPEEEEAAQEATV
ncbi:unnamed protein product, partial [Staurois parvus]